MVKRNRDILKQILQWLFVITIFFLCLITNGFADTLSAKEIKELLEETRALRNEVAQLKKELAEHTREHQPAAKPKKAEQQFTAKPQQPPIVKRVQPQQKTAEVVKPSKPVSAVTKTKTDRKSVV